MVKEGSKEHRAALGQNVSEYPISVTSSAQRRISETELLASIWSSYLVTRFFSLNKSIGP